MSETAPIQRDTSEAIDSISFAAANPCLIALKALFATLIAAVIVKGSILHCNMFLKKNESQVFQKNIF
jgi:hypothetical protein